MTTLIELISDVQKAMQRYISATQNEARKQDMTTLLTTINGISSKTALPELQRYTEVLQAIKNDRETHGRQFWGYLSNDPSDYQKTLDGILNTHKLETFMKSSTAAISPSLAKAVSASTSAPASAPTPTITAATKPSQTPKNAIQGTQTLLSQPTQVVNGETLGSPLLMTAVAQYRKAIGAQAAEQGRGAPNKKPAGNRPH